LGFSGSRKNAGSGCFLASAKRNNLYGIRFTDKKN